MRMLSIRGACFAGVLAAATLASAGEKVVCRLVDPAQANAVAASYGISAQDTTAPAPFVLFDLPLGVDPDIIEAAMIGDPRIVWAEDDIEAESPETESGKGSVANVIGDRALLYSANASLLNQIHWSGADTNKHVGRPVRLAILDTGLSPDVTRLWKRVVASANMLSDGKPPYDIPYNLDTNGNGTPDDGLGHGTMIAGIVDMLAPRVDLIIARVADSDGRATSWSILKGLAYAAVNGAEVANISLGSLEQLGPLGDVLEWAEQQGIVTFAPIGNLGTRDALFPAGYSTSVCVTGVLPNDRKAPFSCWDSDADMSAPATGIQSTWWDGKVGTWSGTSFASPMAAAATADALRRAPLRTPVRIRELLERAGDNIDHLNPAYSGKLGPRLNWAKVQSMLRKSPK